MFLRGNNWAQLPYSENLEVLRVGSAPGLYATIQNAVDAAPSGSVIEITPGAYIEDVVIETQCLTLIGLAPRGACAIVGSLQVTADDVTIVNVGVAGASDGDYAINLNAATRFRAYGCKIEGPDATVTLLDGVTDDQCADILFEDCEFCWGGSGVIFDNSDYGYPTQIFFEKCRFHNLTAAAMAEASGGGVNDIHVNDCIFGNLEDGSNPTKFINLVGASNSGIVAGCKFPVAINSGLNLVDTGIVWSSNFHTGGISTGQPS